MNGKYQNIKIKYVCNGIWLNSKKSIKVLVTKMKNEYEEMC